MPNPGPATTISPHQLLQADSSDGYQIGSLSTTPIGMYGVTPVAQRSNANQLTVSSVATSGLLVSLQTAGLTAAAVGGLGGSTQVLLINTNAPVGWQIATTDYTIVNKPSAQSNIGIGNARPHGATAGQVIVQYLTVGTGTSTPTAAEAYTMGVFKGIAGTVTLSPAACGANSCLEQTFNVTGISVGQIVSVTKPSEQQGLCIAGARAAGNNLLGITFLNVSAAAITPVSSEAYTYVATAGYSANSNLMLYGVNIGASVSVAVGATTQSWGTTDIAVTVSTIATSDILLSANKPTNQQNIAMVGSKISAANVISFQFAAGAVTGVTPTVSENYSALIYRPNPQPPVVLLSVTCTPSAIGGFQTANQSFTVTPIAASSVVWVNKPTNTSGIGILGCRVSAAGVVEIQFVNSVLSTTITPPSEVYVFGNIQPVPNATHQCAMQVGNGLIGTNAQANELRLAMSNIGMITGGTP